MSLYKRGNTWWIDVNAPNGKRIQESTRTSNKTFAQEYHDKLKSDLWRIHHLGEKPKIRWQEAVVKWLKERHLDTINRALIDRITDAKIAEGVTNATANRVLEVLRAILRKAVNEWEWLDKAPQIRMLKEPTRRIRWLTHEEAERLLAALPEHLADMAAFSLSTGLRRANVTGLQWSQVDLSRRVAWIHPDQAKARKAIPVPLNAEAVLNIRKQLGKNITYVFTYNGKKVTQVNTKTWHKALNRVGIENFRWHDLRHTWASWHVQQGTPLFALQELGGWESPEMVRKYAHLACEHLAPYADKLCSLRSVGVSEDDTITAQSTK